MPFFASHHVDAAAVDERKEGRKDGREEEGLCSFFSKYFDWLSENLRKEKSKELPNNLLQDSYFFWFFSEEKEFFFG